MSTPVIQATGTTLHAQPRRMHADVGVGVDVMATATTNNHSHHSRTEEKDVQDLLLLRPSALFLVPFSVVCAAALVAFGLVRGMCNHGVPPNCNLNQVSSVLQQLISLIERIFLVAVLGGFGFIVCTRDRWKQTFGMICILVATCGIVSGGLTDAHIGQGTSPVRFIVGIILLGCLLPPLIHHFSLVYSARQRWKALGIFSFYLVFIIANAAIGELHLHHWTWSFIYLTLLYHKHQQHPPSLHLDAQPPIPIATNTTRTRASTAAQIMHCWGHVSSMIATGIMVNGIAAYGSLYHFRSAGDSLSP